MSDVRYVMLSELIDMFGLPAHERLYTLLAERYVLGIGVYVCRVYDSSQAGNVQGVIFGEGCTYASDTDLPPRIGDAPSRFHELEAVYRKLEYDAPNYDDIVPDYAALAVQARKANLENLPLMNPKEIREGLRLVNEEGDGYLVWVRGDAQGEPFSFRPLMPPDSPSERHYLSGMYDRGFVFVNEYNYTLGRLDVPDSYRKKELKHQMAEKKRKAALPKIERIELNDRQLIKASNTTTKPRLAELLAIINADGVDGVCVYRNEDLEAAVCVPFGRNGQFFANADVLPDTMTTPNGALLTIFGVWRRDWSRSFHDHWDMYRLQENRYADYQSGQIAMIANERLRGVYDAYGSSRDGIIRTPGKFEGEPLWVAYFWEAYLHGEMDDDVDGVIIFKVDDNDRRMFPSLTDEEYVGLFESEQGFVNSVTGDSLPVEYGGKWTADVVDDDMEF